MVRCQAVMWWKLTLTLLLASIASSSSSGYKNKSNRSISGSTCPENCRCTQIQPTESVNINYSYNNNNNDDNNINRTISTEIRCKGSVPGAKFLPGDTQRLVVEGTKPDEIMNMLLEVKLRLSGNNTNNGTSDKTSKLLKQRLNNSNNLILQELVLNNCSLNRLNITLITVSNSVFGKSLNLSDNEFADTRSLNVGNHLERLDLSRNRFSRVRSEAFVKFSRLLVLNLRQNEIKVVEERGFVGLGNLESLDLSENRLTTLIDGTFSPLFLLQKLDLSGNKLVGVLVGGHEWFDGLGRLKELDVSRNGKAINTNITGNISDNQESRGNERHVALEGLPIGLKILRLAENPLTDVELSLVLGSGRRLETVDASRLDLDRVPSALTRSVHDLILSGNRLTSIRSGDFDSYPLLRIVDLSKNIVNNVEEDAFGRLENLEKLDLSNNRLTEIPQSLPSSLLNLLLSHNSIESLSARDLQGVYKLQKLVINNNAIKEIELGSMSQLGVLAELDISDNPIKQLPANTFSGPRYLISVRMSGLISLEWDQEKRADMAFPISAPERLVTLDLSRSPALAAQLLADEAALSACKSLRQLNLSQTNLTALRSDLAYLLPQLHTLGLSDNQWNCTSSNIEEILWLAEWINQHDEIQPPGKCASEDSQRHQISSNNNSILLSQLTSYFFELDNNSVSTEQRSSANFPIGNNSLSIEAKTSTEDIKSSFVNPESLNSNKNSNSDAQQNIIDITASKRGFIANSSDSDIENVTKLESSKPLNNYSIFVAEAKDTIETSDVTVRDSINSTTRQSNNEIVDNNEHSSNTSKGIALTTKTTALERNVESIDDTVAEELIGREELAKSLSRNADVTSTSTIGAHPGMLVIVGALFGAVVALSVILSRRTTFADESRMQSFVLLNRENQQHQENIEINSFDHQHSIVSDLW